MLDFLKNKGDTMRYITFLLYTAAMVLIAIFLGCSTENPLCSDNFCVEGDIFPRDHLFFDEEYSEVAVDETVLLNIITSTAPPIPALTNTPSLSNIVAHVAAGGRECLEQTYTITATVDFNLLAIGGKSMTLVTNNDDISFFITAYDDPDSLADYQVGETYTFTLFISGIGRYNEDNRRDQSIFSTLAE